MTRHTTDDRDTEPNFMLPTDFAATRRNTKITPAPPQPGYREWVCLHCNRKLWTIIHNDKTRWPICYHTAKTNRENQMT